MKKSIVIIVSAVLVAIIAILVWLNLSQRSEMSEMIEQLEFEKEALEVDGYQQMDIRNDSLAELLSKEQQRMRDLMEELRITKVTNARRIAELKKELATVRAVMVVYVQQIDSLNRTN